MIFPRFSGYSVYYSTCGGSADGDCTPSCGDGCTIDEFDECCDSDSLQHRSAYVMHFLF